MWDWVTRRDRVTAIQVLHNVQIRIPAAGVAEAVGDRGLGCSERQELPLAGSVSVGGMGERGETASRRSNCSTIYLYGFRQLPLTKPSGIAVWGDRDDRTSS